MTFILQGLSPSLPMMLRRNRSRMELWMSLLMLRVPAAAFRNASALWPSLLDAQASSGLPVSLALPHPLVVLVGLPRALEVTWRLCSTGATNSAWVKLPHHSLEASSAGPLPVQDFFGCSRLLWHRTPVSSSFSKHNSGLLTPLLEVSTPQDKPGHLHLTFCPLFLSPFKCFALIQPSSSLLL